MSESRSRKRSKGELNISSSTMSGHIIPDLDNGYDIGSASYKIRDMFVSENSLWIGDTHKISIESGKMKFRKRKTSSVPSGITSVGGNSTAALAHSGKGSLSLLSTEDWLSYKRTFNPNARIDDVFAETDFDDEDEIDTISGLQAALNAKTTPAYVDSKVASLVASAPATLDTLNELAAALGDDANHVTTMTNLVGTKLSLSGGTMTGAITTNSTFDGRNVSTDGTKLDGIATSANNYSHPTGDGALHVPATGTTNGGKVLTAGETAGSLSWETPSAGSGGDDSPMQATGGTITNISGYQIHTFSTSGVFTPDKNGLVDALIIGGGGGAAGWSGGSAGGGAGVLYYKEGHLVGSVPYNIVIGAGGGTDGGAANGFNGGDTVALGLIAGGGTGGMWGPGGGLGGNTPSASSYTGWTGYGGHSGSTFNPGGGAGSGGPGSGMTGGVGFTTSITGSAYEYASGGTGSTASGGTGGANGDVGSGRGGSAPGGSGGSGVVVLRYVV